MIKKFLKRNFMIIVMGFAVIFSGGSLMAVSQNVHDKQSKISRMEREAQAIEWEIRALNAEMAYLSRPDRMEQLASAMAQSISPMASNDIMVISPASFSPFEPKNLSLIPNRKPAVSNIRRVSAPVHVAQKSPTPVPQPQKQPKPSQDFSSLLDNLGGI